MLKQEIEDGQASLADPQFRADVLNGLALRPRAIPARWFYDRRGSELFEDITGLPEYYPTRTEIGILRRIGPELQQHIGPGQAVVEFGSGSSMKTPLLLEAIRPAAYVPVDISGDFLRESAGRIAGQFPDIAVEPVEADFTRPLTLPKGLGAMPRLGFFPGSTIGNMLAARAVELLRNFRDVLGEGARFLIGIDRIKPLDVLIPAYDDAAGITAAFNLNLLERINRELAGTIPLDAFAHRAIWNDARARIEMHLEATRDMTFAVDGRVFSIAAGETIHTENSHKYGPRDARLLLRAGGWTPIAEWTDPDDWFALILAEAGPERFAP
ncbi:L-histidine N(alpha)-methyltransferase [Sphingomonas cannabina]|uniref:L-histidine N(alpha)-methyltransferase n=1 Tax=Sphingomonas cannabina TaxID=2899123 RepID=UPI001F2B6059|nr:L-histidine N(alpha)-methyltransferase [Sphingomonas cannabina]UIJ46120.1 L-histidine N(alpha)-methyltransferase [Sphingomonas cannabina]